MSIEKEIGNAGTWINTHAKALVVLAFVYLMVASPIGLTIVQRMGIVNPGFPGAQSACLGVNFKDFGSDWTGVQTIHYVNNSEPTLVSHSGLASSDRVYWGGGSGPESMTVVHDSNAIGTESGKENQLSTEIQTQIPLASFNYQNSTPLTLTNASTWDQGLDIQYWSAQATGSTIHTLSNGTRVNETTYTATSQSLLLIPGNFYLSISIPPSQNVAGTSSGWQEGTWSQVDFWYVVYWYEWLNAFGQLLQQNDAPPPIPNDAFNRQEQFNLRGGFPIAGWIQGYESPIPTSTGTIYDLYQFDTRGNQQKTYAGSQISSSTLANILNQIQLNPSLTGRQLTLYTQPGDQYQLPIYTLPSGPIDTDPNFATQQGLTHSPDFQTVLPAEYFKIGVNTFGTYADGSILSGWTVYYPTVDYLLRFIFGVYGTHTFVWTVDTAMSLGYNSTSNYQVPPAQWQNRTVQIANTAGLLTGLTDWFSNPLNSLQFYAIVIIIVLLIITVLNPGVWTVALGRKKED